MDLSLPSGVGVYIREEIKEMIHKEKTVADYSTSKFIKKISTYLFQTGFSPRSLSKFEYQNLIEACEEGIVAFCGYIATVPDFIDNYQDLPYEAIRKLKMAQSYELIDALKRGVPCRVISRFLNAKHSDYLKFAESSLWSGSVGKVLFEMDETFDIPKIAQYKSLIKKIIGKDGPKSEKLNLSLIFPEYASEILGMKYSREKIDSIEPTELRKLFPKLSPVRSEMEKHMGWDKLEVLYLFHKPTIFDHYYDGWKENKYFDLIISNIMSVTFIPDLREYYTNYLKKIALEERQGVIYGMLQEKVGFVGPIDYSSLEVDNAFEEHLWRDLDPSYNHKSPYRKLKNSELWYLYRQMFESMNVIFEGGRMSLSRLSLNKYNLDIFFGDSFCKILPEQMSPVCVKMHSRLSEMFGVNVNVHVDYKVVALDFYFLESFLNQFLDQCDPGILYQRVIQILRETFDYTTRAFLITCHARLVVRYPKFGLPLYARLLFDKPLTESKGILSITDLFTNWSDNIEDAFNNMNLIYLRYEPHDFLCAALVGDVDGALKELTGDYETDIKMIVSSLEKALPLRYGWGYENEGFPW